MRSKITGAPFRSLVPFCSVTIQEGRLGHRGLSRFRGLASATRSCGSRTSQRSSLGEWSEPGAARAAVVLLFVLFARRSEEKKYCSRRKKKTKPQKYKTTKEHIMLFCFVCSPKHGKDSICFIVLFRRNVHPDVGLLLEDLEQRSATGHALIEYKQYVSKPILLQKHCFPLNSTMSAET